MLNFCDSVGTFLVLCRLSYRKWCVSAADYSLSCLRSVIQSWCDSRMFVLMLLRPLSYFGHYFQVVVVQVVIAKLCFSPLLCNKPLELGRCVRTHLCKDTSQHEWLKGQARIKYLRFRKLPSRVWTKPLAEKSYVSACCLLRISLLRLVDSTFPEIPGLGIPP